MCVKKRFVPLQKKHDTDQTELWWFLRTFFFSLMPPRVPKDPLSGRGNGRRVSRRRRRLLRIRTDNRSWSRQNRLFFFCMWREDGIAAAAACFPTVFRVSVTCVLVGVIFSTKRQSIRSFGCGSTGRFSRGTCFLFPKYPTVVFIFFFLFPYLWRPPVQQSPNRETPAELPRARNLFLARPLPTQNLSPLAQIN